MASKRYEEELSNLLIAIDLAIQTIKEVPPIEYESHHIQHTIDHLNQTRKRRIEAEPRYRNLASLKYDIEVVFTYYNEAMNPTTDYFWKLIKEHNLPYVRNNFIQRILRRKKIKDESEYNYVKDVMVAMLQEGSITQEDFGLLSLYIEKYESSYE
jgi:hypothetical protein